MNYLSTLFLLIGVAFFSGCASASPEPFKTVPIKSIPSSISETDVLFYKVSGNIDSASDIENTAVVLVEASKVFKKRGYNYFRIANYKTNSIHKVITNMSDLISYCYPSKEKSSSLEDKCNLTNKMGNIRFSFYAFIEPPMESFTWSVDQVLNDPIVKSNYNSALVDFKDKTISYENVSSKKMYRYLKSK